MSLEEFGKGHKGAGNTPVQGETTPTEQPAAAPSFPIRKVVSTSEDSQLATPLQFDSQQDKVAASNLQHITDEKGVVRPLIPNSKTGTLEPAQYADEYLYNGKETPEGNAAKTKWKTRGGAVIGETHDEQGSLIESKPAEPEVKKVGKKAAFIAQKGAAKAPKESQSESAYEDKLRQRMPFPGYTNVSKSQESILTSAMGHLKILTDHWNKANSIIGDDVSNPAFAAHADIGASLNMAHTYLNSSRATKGKNQNISHEHMRLGTEALHDANKKMWNNTGYSIVAGDNPPIGTAATDENRAHALVEFPTRKEEGRLAHFIKLGRGKYDINGSSISSKVENTQEFYDRLEKTKQQMNHPDPEISGQFAGVNRGLFAQVFKVASRPTPRGGQPWSQDNLGPESINGRFGTGPLISSYGVGDGIKNISQGSNFDTGRPPTLVKTRVPMVQTHPSPLPANADIVRHKVTRQPWASVNGKLVETMPEDSDKVMVPFGQHTGLKVTDKFGREVPHVDEKGRLLSLKKLGAAGAKIEDTIAYILTPSAPNAPKPVVTAAPAAPRKLTSKELNEQDKRIRLKKENEDDIERAQNDLSDSIERAYSIVQQRKLEKKSRTKSASSIINTIGQDIAASAKPAKAKKGKAK